MVPRDFRLEVSASQLPCKAQVVVHRSIENTLTQYIPHTVRELKCPLSSKKALSVSTNARVYRGPSWASCCLPGRLNRDAWRLSRHKNIECAGIKTADCFQLVGDGGHGWWRGTAALWGVRFASSGLTHCDHVLRQWSCFCAALSSSFVFTFSPRPQHGPLVVSLGISCSTKVQHDDLITASCKWKWWWDKRYCDSL